MAGQLSQQFYVDHIESLRLLYIRLNQKQLRAEEHVHLRDSESDAWPPIATTRNASACVLAACR
eukprot:213076-Hanusia_phi.AAC.1